MKSFLVPGNQKIPKALAEHFPPLTADIGLEISKYFRLNFGRAIRAVL